MKKDLVVVEKKCVLRFKELELNGKPVKEGGQIVCIPGEATTLTTKSGAVLEIRVLTGTLYIRPQVGNDEE